MCPKKTLPGAGIGEAPVQPPPHFYKLELAERDEA